MNKVRVKTWTAWLALLMAVLLPLRGWAMATMPGAPGTPGLPAHQAMAGAAEQVAPQAHRFAVTMPPCHGGIDGEHARWAANDTASDDAGPAAGEDGSSATHTCASCALCHSAIAADALPAPPGPPALAEARCMPTARDTGRLLIDTLERPPRA